MNVLKGTASDPRVIEQIDDLYAHCGFVEDSINYALGSGADFAHLLLAVEEIEFVIGRAIAGEAPNRFDWGPLTASEFLQVVHDVTSWALTNFEAFNARPAAESLPVPTWLAGAPLFDKSPRYQPSFDSARPVRMLSSVNNPALRCPALWWAHILLSEVHNCCNPKNLGLLARQWHLLRSRCPTGLQWLRERMGRWSAAYVRQHGLRLNRYFGLVIETAERKVSS